MRLRHTLAAGLAVALVSGLTGAVSWADEPPSQGEVEAAESAARSKARAVAGVKADLAVANARLETSAVAAAQAAEAYNGALWQLEEAKAAAMDARAAADAAATGVRRQQRAYGDALVRSYQSSPEIAGVAAVLESDGIQAFVQQRVTMDNAVGALEGRYDQFRASATVAELSSRQAETAEAEAAALEKKSRTLRDAAAGAATTALAEAEAIAARKTELIAELATLEGISVELATRRQQALEAKAAEEAEEARRREQQREQERQPDPAPAPQPTPQPTPSPKPEPKPAPSDEPRPTPAPAPAPKPQPKPDPAPVPAPAPAKGAAAAANYAAAQLGEPYVWGAAGPNSWDCSGLTMKAWAAGGKSLPHWSVGQYRATTPIKASNLRKGDLVFWSNTSNPDTIFHVALYVGDGQIIHAPRTGRPVVRESMYYWRSPNFFTRP
ncbi:C40 family peptidase [Nocardioides jishulii]|uniref:NlpC/P60 family protein n=1 Tax=Nocardioides jishulii TaxID=2575440 RepID=A0A4U2YT72_9ACTN|nr:C40 family peptidase [Nocardioides jishulii]TKI64370.1 NlpC/P60 family protein [Nocardioides jishulii]